MATSGDVLVDGAWWQRHGGGPRTYVIGEGWMLGRVAGLATVVDQGGTPEVGWLLRKGRCPYWRGRSIEVPSFRGVLR